MRKLKLPSNLITYLKYGSLIFAITLVVNMFHDSNETSLSKLTQRTLDQTSQITDETFIKSFNFFINKTSELNERQHQEFKGLFKEVLVEHEERAESANRRIMSDILEEMKLLELEVGELRDRVVRRHNLEQFKDGASYKKYNFYRFVWVTTISNNDGFADEAIDFIIPLCNKYPMFGWVDEDTRFWRLRVKGRSEEQMKILVQCQEKGRELLEMKAIPGIAILQFAPPVFERVIKETFPQLQDFHYLVGRTMFETNGLPKGWADNSNTYLNELWVPSEYHVSVFKGHGVTVPVKAVGEGYDNDRFNPDIVSSARKELFPTCEEGDYIFLAISKWEDRKGYDHLQEAYRDAFTRNERVCLAIRSDNLKSSIRFDNPNYLNTCKVDRLSDEQYPMAFKSADAYITASHGEGWGRPTVEAMAMGLPAIVPVWGGVTAYASDDVVIPILVDKLEPAYPAEPGYIEGTFGHQWAKVEVPRIKAAMQRVYNDQEAAKAIGQAAREYVLENFARDTIAERVLERTNDIFERRFDNVTRKFEKAINVIKEEPKVDMNLVNVPNVIQYVKSTESGPNVIDTDNRESVKSTDSSSSERIRNPRAVEGPTVVVFHPEIEDGATGDPVQSTESSKPERNPWDIEGPTVVVFHPKIEDGATGEPVIRDDLVIEGGDVVDSEGNEVENVDKIREIGYW